jgi:Domain of unknown function (DUF4234)
MAETVSIEGEGYLKRNPLGVLGLMIITIGIYFFYWYYKINEEIQRFERDDTMSPTRSLMAMIFGWLIIVPPFIAMYNTAKHVQAMERRLGIQPELEPALAVVIMLFVSVGNGIYIQEHLNRVWDRAAGGGEALPDRPPPLPQAPPG